MVSKTSITKSEHYQLLGLAGVAAKHSAVLDELEATAENIVGAKRNDGWATELLSNDVDDVLRRLEITVRD